MAHETIDFAKQKIDYIHYDPVSGKWNLAKDYLYYYYYSARFYETGVDDPIAIGWVFK